MRVADYIAKRLFFLGCRNVFMVTGGAAMHLNDSFGRVFKDSVYSLHHEQSCSMAAEGYARITGHPCIVNVTAGPGSINAINGVFGAYVDSVPMIVVSGQAKTETLTTTYPHLPLRQLGDQEVDIVKMVSGVCKYVTLVRNPLEIDAVVDKAYFLATSGRHGPAWIDVPIDIQAYNLPSEYDDKVISQSNHYPLISGYSDPQASDDQILAIAKALLYKRRPVLYVGSAIRHHGIYSQFLDFLDNWPIAVVTAWNNNDLLHDEHPSYAGRGGSVGNRAGNFAVQHSECVIILGCRLNIRLVSYNWESFAKDAWKCHVDIDQAELDKPTLSTDLKINSTLVDFFPRLSECLNTLVEANPQVWAEVKAHWLRWNHFHKDNLKEFNATVECNSPKESAVNPYRLISVLSSRLYENDVVVCADGTACVVGFQAAHIKKGQRWFHNSGCASMGYELPASIGAYYATKKRIICIAGDGSIMMNLQELSYIGGNSLPIKILLLNNLGYHSIRQTQRNYFPDNPVGCGVESGLPFPDFSQLAIGFGFHYLRVDSEHVMDSSFDRFLNDDHPCIYEAFLDLEQDFVPKLASKKLADGSMVTAELHDMTPILSQNTMNSIKRNAMST